MTPRLDGAIHVDFKISYDYGTSLHEEKDYNKLSLNIFNKASQITF